ncbi:MAG: tRNA pseudouridine(55) synthase TruB [Desulfovibrio sp.]
MGRRPKRSANQKDGVIVIHKPKGPTSAGCLNTIKRELNQGRIGHAGTLDPMAEGVLVVLLGTATKIAGYLSGAQKTYYGECDLGYTTDTYDAEGEITSKSSIDQLTEEEVKKEVLAWLDLTEQEVPAYSAAKHKGKPLYALARAGEEVPVKIKPITIYTVEVLDITLPQVRFRVKCSAGTYIRSLVHSLGTRLGCGATLTKLFRELSSPFGIDSAYPLDELVQSPELFAERVTPLSEALPHWQSYTLTPALTGLVKNGAWLPVNDEKGELLHGKEGDQVFFKDSDGQALALAEAKLKDDKLQWSILRGLWA